MSTLLHGLQENENVETPVLVDAQGNLTLTIAGKASSGTSDFSAAISWSGDI